MRKTSKSYSSEDPLKYHQTFLLNKNRNGFCCGTTGFLGLIREEGALHRRAAKSPYHPTRNL
jgi:hypothetical protein